MMEIYDHNLCVDCVSYIYNDEFSDSLDGDDIKAIHKGCKDLGFISVDTDNGTNFSWTACTCCQRQFAGDRYTAKEYIGITA